MSASLIGAPVRSVQQMIEGQELHHVTHRNGLSGRVVDQAIGPDGRGQHGRALAGEEVQPALGIAPHAQEFLAAIGAGPVEVGAQRHGLRQHGLAWQALEAQQEGSHEQQEGHEGRYRIARQAHEEGFALPCIRAASHLAEGQRLARLHGDLPQVDAPFGFHGRLDVVFLAHRHAAAGDDEVMLARRLAQGLAGGGQIVGDDAVVADLAAQLLQQAAQQETVGIVDGARLQGFARHGQFITGEEHRHPHAPQHVQAGLADGCRQSQLLRTQAGPDGQDGAALADILADIAHPFTGLGEMAYRDVLAIDFAGFLHDHGVGAIGQHGAGEDARRRASVERLAHMAGRDTLGYTQARLPGGAIGSAHGIAVHLRIVHAGDVDRRLDRCGQHAATGVQGRDSLVVTDRHGRGEQGVERLAHALHGRTGRFVGRRGRGDIGLHGWPVWMEPRRSAVFLAIQRPTFQCNPPRLAAKEKRRPGRWARTASCRAAAGLQAGMLGHEGLHTGGLGGYDLEALRQRLDVLEAGRTVGVAAQGFADGFVELGRQCSFQHDHGHPRGKVLTRHLDAVGGVGIDRDAVGLFGEADGLQAVGMGGTAGGETVPDHAGEFIAVATGLAGQVEAAGGLDLVEQGLHAGAVATQQVVDEALEVGGLADVHAGAAGVIGLGRLAHAVDASAEELVEHVVLVGGHHQLVDGQAHHAGDVAGADVAEVARGHGEGHLLRVAGGCRQVATEVVHHLGHHARPVDRVDGADLLGGLVLQVVGDGLDDVLAVIEDAFDGQVEDVGILQAEHLGRLEGAHLLVRRQHEDTDALLAAHGVFGGTASVTRGGADDVQFRALLGQRVLEQVAQQLHGHILEGQRGAVGQALQHQLLAILLLQRTQRGDLGGILAGASIAVDVGGVGLVRQGLEVGFGDVGGKLLQHLDRQVGIRQLAPLVQLGAADLRILRRQIQAAIGRQAAQQDFGKGRCGSVTAGGNVVHVDRKRQTGGWVRGIGESEVSRRLYDQPAHCTKEQRPGLVFLFDTMRMK
eukprot:TRINITY_DN743_c1_g3_i1.p1 TRINITY_DN743_c1_g3~~TRINITY_DN743_c1_g3_i1.p1  ORF type:complete len:1024 (-),score=374.04 TRINITY_DN743_c1_g3_i1:652-3723(-)